MISRSAPAAPAARPMPRRAPQDLDRLRPQRPVDRLVVLVGQLAHLVVELGLADLRVLRLARGLELGDRRRRTRVGPPPDARPRPPQRPLITNTRPRARRARSRTDTSEEARQTSSRTRTRRRGAAPRSGARRRHRSRVRRARAGTGHSAISPPIDRDDRAEPQPRDERRDDQQERDRPRVASRTAASRPWIAPPIAQRKSRLSACGCCAGGTRAQLLHQRQERPGRPG